jgi:hypothetical protein
MRFSLSKLLKLSVVVPAAAAAVSLAGCSYPFSVDVSSGVTLPLGAAVNCAEANAGVMEGTIPANGEPDAHGNLTHFEHAFYAGNICTLRADWTGPLVDMDAIRADADAQMRDLGLDPDDVDVYIRRFEPKVTAVGFDHEMVLPGVTYRASVGVPASPKLITLEAAEGADLTQPEVNVSTRKKRFLRAANRAWRERAPMDGVAAVDIDIDLDEAGMNATLPEALRVDFNVHLYGDAAARAMVHEEDVDALMANDPD